MLNQSVLQVLPRPGHIIIPAQTLPPVSAVQPERSNQEVSSGAGELSDSVSVPEVGVSHIRKKKSRVRRPSVQQYFLSLSCCVIFFSC